MKLSSREVAVIEAATREQSGRALWQAIRNGRLTRRNTEVSTNNRFAIAGKGHNGPMKKELPQIGCRGGSRIS